MSRKLEGDIDVEEAKRNTKNARFGSHTKSLVKSLVDSLLTGMCRVVKRGIKQT